MPEEDVETPPKPEEDLEKYTKERLQAGLKFIKGAEKRNITPRTQQYLRFYKDAYKVALEGTRPKKASCAVVQKMDEVYCSSAFYFRARSSAEHQRHQLYLKLRQLELLGNYRDYLGQEPQAFRANLKETKKDDNSSEEVRQAASKLGPAKMWLQIAEELKEADVAELRKNMDVACNILNLDPNHMTWLIAEWEKRNTFFHSQIRENITDCDWTRLAEQLCRDLKELLNVEVDQDLVDQYEKVIVGFRDRYFDVVNPRKVKGWFPNERARKETRELLAKQMKEKK
ncbi:MAG: hypothetical protein Q9167_005973 [Letrouitia subvulpina]